MDKENDPTYRMTLSLNVLNHLGLNLYSNIPAVLSEVVANAWDADAKVVDIIVHENRDRDVRGAKVTFTPWMPEMGHGVFSPLKVTEKGDGLYAVEDIALVMGGFALLSGQ